MHNPYSTDFFIHSNYTKRLNEMNIKIVNDRYSAALYIKRAEIHMEFNNEASAISDLLIADGLDKNNIKVVGALMTLYFEKGDTAKSNKYKIRYQLLEHQLKITHEKETNINLLKVSRERIAIQNLVNKENYIPNILGNFKG